MKFNDTVQEIAASPLRFKVSDAKHEAPETNLLKFFDNSPGIDPEKSFDSNRPPSHTGASSGKNSGKQSKKAQSEVKAKKEKKIIKTVTIEELVEQRIVERNEINRSKYNPVLQPYLKKYKNVDENEKTVLQPDVYTLIKEEKPKPKEYPHKRHFPEKFVSLVPV